MAFAASEWEFRARFWNIWVTFWAGFLLYIVDHRPLALTLALRLSPGANDAQAIHLVKCVFAVGTALVIIAAAIRSWAEAYLHSSIVHDAALHGEQLVADGPYRYVRNPLYLGNMFLSVGVGLLATLPGFLVIAIGNFVIVYRLILREEATLLASQGESYRRYFAAVPRLLPSLAPRVPASGARPNWTDGITGEIFMWSGAAAMAVYTATLRFGLFWIVFGTGLAIYFLQAWVRQRAKKRAARI
jgi:protein-S-isoprenylcysteine O-methyltransferase Ste14